MFGLGKPGAKSLIQKLRSRSLTLDQIAAMLPPDGQGRPVSRVTLSKVLVGEYSGAQLVERLRDLGDGKPSQTPPPARSISPSPQRRGESRRTTRPHTPGRVGSTPAPATTPAPRSPAPAVPLLDDVAPTEIGAPVYFDKDVIGYVGPNGAIVKERPQPPAMPPARPTRQPQSPVPARRALREQYNVLRQAGLSDSEAQRRLREQRQEIETQQAERRETERASAWERQVAKLAPQFIAAARRHLSQAGVYREEAVAQVARQMAERSLVLEQPLRQADTQPVLPPPRLPALPPAQVAEPIYQGIRRPGHAAVALGGERRVLPEEARQAIHEAVAEWARRGKL